MKLPTLPIKEIEKFSTKYNRSMIDAKELSLRDDIVTRLVLDPDLGFISHKMNFKKFRKIREAEKLKNIIEAFKIQRNYSNVFESLEKHRLIKGYYKIYNKSGYRELLRYHVYSYLKAHDQTCGFRIESCGNRYSGDKNGAKVIATKHWYKKQKIRDIVGFIAEMDFEEAEDFLVPGKNDFSVIYSLRKKTSQLWLGTAAFLNHDCAPNCRLNATGLNDRVSLEVIQDIEIGDELTMSYGVNFFENKNANCECDTCKRKGCGAFKRDDENAVPNNKQKYNFRDTNNRIKRLKRSDSLSS